MQTRQPPNGPPCGSVVGIQLPKINEGGEGCNAVYPSRGLLTRLPRRIRLSPSPVVIVARHRDCASRSECEMWITQSRNQKHGIVRIHQKAQSRRSLLLSATVYSRHRAIIKKASPKLKVSEAEIVRRALEAFAY